MATVFITGSPGSGKSTLAKKVAKETGATHIYIDGLKKTLRKDSHLKPWVEFFYKIDEEKYWKETSKFEHWHNMVKQSEVFWPRIKKVIKSFQEKNTLLIVDGANIMPALVRSDFPEMKGIAFAAPSRKVLFDRFQKTPRWSRTSKKLQRVESKRYWDESKRYKRTAIENGYESFKDFDKAFNYLISKLKQ